METKQKSKEMENEQAECIHPRYLPRMATTLTNSLPDSPSVTLSSSPAIISDDTATSSSCSSSSLPTDASSTSSSSSSSFHPSTEYSSHTVYRNTLPSSLPSSASSLFTPFIPTSTLRSEWQTQGYVRMNSFLSSAEVRLLKEALTEIIQHRLPSLPPEHKFFDRLDDPSTLKQIQSLASYHPTIQALALTKCHDLALYLLSHHPNHSTDSITVECVNQQYFNKHPRHSTPTPPHQDGAYFLLTPPEALTIWIALDYVDEENGCVRYIPSSPRSGTLRDHGPSGILGFSRSITDYNDTDRSKECIQIAEPGDLIAHHALTIHRADGNRSTDRTRQAIGFIYYSSLAQEDTEAKQLYQEKLKQRLLDENKIR